MPNKCAYYMIARIQRQNEVKRGEGLEGTQSYVKIGCFHCQGYKTDCPTYYRSGVTRQEEDNKRNLKRKVGK